MALREQSIEEKCEFFVEIEQVFVKEYNTLVRFASGYTHDRDAAEDVVAQSFAQALSHPHQYTPGTNAKAWIYNITRNVAINHWRRKDREHFRYGDPNELSTIVDSNVMKSPSTSWNSSNPEDNIVVLDAYQKKKEEIARRIKNPHQRLAVELRFFYGMSYQEIVDETGWPLGTVMSRLHRGTRGLGMILNDFSRVNLK
ncbi:hypothetical protein COY27_06895 [Candidatus Woesearchaeota archaeon CG_4_10_14_0_2_um_filter_33_13]|nr:MAG: hypothetical protein COY27_06895 [Candidatus Woesearchaeota archaeon CG_4_10_14_0_2_um_filter_33_13]